MNFCYPANGQPKKVYDYFERLNATEKAQYAFRKPNTPKEENFFPTAADRIRFENIICDKGMDILNQVEHAQINQRPLGMTNPSKKLLGTGTLFFTWRNTSNTSPIVFWWGIGNYWFPFFPLVNRGG